MSKFFEIAAMIGLPLAWGLGVEYIFERLRRRTHTRHVSTATIEPGNDWVI